MTGHVKNMNSRPSVRWCWRPHWCPKPLWRLIPFALRHRLADQSSQARTEGDRRKDRDQLIAAWAIVTCAAVAVVCVVAAITVGF